MTTPWGIILSVEARDLRLSNFLKVNQLGNVAWRASLCCDKSMVPHFQTYPSILCFVTLQMNWPFCFFRGILKIGGTSRKACHYCWHSPPHNSGFLTQQWCLVPVVSLMGLLPQESEFLIQGPLSRLLGSITPTFSLCPSSPRSSSFFLQVLPLLSQHSPITTLVLQDPMLDSLCNNN